MDVTTILLATIILYAIAYYVYHHLGKTRKMLYYADKLDGPRGLPLIGSAFYLLGSNTTVAKNAIYLIKKFKSPWKLWLGTGLYVVVTRPEDVEIVLNQALSKARNYKFTKPILEEGLFTAPGPY
jgi:cytochrome P450 family 4